MAENRNLRVVTAFVAAVYQCGVRQVCISPGSRSTPLAMAFARHGEFRIWSILDERSAGFFAVGAARATQEPVILVCTSGTATANYLPAAMEAHNARLPLMFLTADRPPELHGVGANQTVPQQGLYGTFPGLSLQMPVPDGSDALIQHATSVALRVAVQLQRHDGPVHVNWPFREPLVPPLEEGALEMQPRRYVRPLPPRPTAADVAEFARVFMQSSRGLIVAGPSTRGEDAPALIRLAQVLGWPLLADALSGVRTTLGASQSGIVMDAYDAYLRSPRVKDALVPDIVLRFGGTPTSKALGQYISGAVGARQVVVDAHTDWNDPFFTVTDLIISDEQAFCDAMAAVLERTDTTSDWLRQWQQVNHEAQAALAEATLGAGWFEGVIYRPLAELLPERGNLFVGNSMPVRDLETLLPAQDKPLHLMANRGVSGIDGVTSSACGAAAASGRTTALVIGDVSFYHDLNALMLPARTGADLLIVVANNDGGGIFSFLPQVAYPDTFAHFQTAHGLTYADAANQFGAYYRKVDNVADYEAALADAMPLNGLRILELTFTVDANLMAHRAIFDAVTRRVEPLCE